MPLGCGAAHHRHVRAAALAARRVRFQVGWVSKLFSKHALHGTDPFDQLHGTDLSLLLDLQLQDAPFEWKRRLSDLAENMFLDDRNNSLNDRRDELAVAHTVSLRASIKIPSPLQDLPAFRFETVHHLHSNRCLRRIHLAAWFRYIQYTTGA